MRRTENILQVQSGDNLITVEVLPEAQIIIPGLGDRCSREPTPNITWKFSVCPKARAML